MPERPGLDFVAAEDGFVGSVFDGASPFLHIVSESPERNGSAHRFNAELSAGKLALRQTVFVTAKGKNFYVILATAPAETWPSLENTFARIFDSFH